MSYALERQTIESRFNTQWAAATPIAWDNVEYVPTPGTAFVAISILNADAFQASIGGIGGYGQLHRFNGIININIFTPEGTGTATARGYADTAAAIFRSWSSSIATSQKITCRSPYITSIGEKEGWYQLNVTVPFFRDEAF